MPTKEELEMMLEDDLRAEDFLRRVSEEIPFDPDSDEEGEPDGDEEEDAWAGLY